MNNKPVSMLTRIAVAKAIGLVFGIIGFSMVPSLVSETNSLFRWGLLLWYPTVGAFIGAFGIFDRHPILDFRMPWWFRGPVIGAWMNLVLVFFAFDAIQQVFESLTDYQLSPFVFVIEGAVVGGVIGFFSTTFGGEGTGLLRSS